MHRQSVVPHCADVGAVAHACHGVLLIWARVEDHHHWCDPPGHPRAELHCCSPLQVMSCLLRLRLVLVLLVLLPSLSRQVAELADHWSGEVLLVLLGLVDVDLDVLLLVEIVHVDPETCTRPPCCYGLGGPGPSRPGSRDTSSGRASRRDACKYSDPWCA